MAQLDLATLRVTIEANADGVKAQLDEVKDAVAHMNDEIEDSGNSVQSVADTMDYFGTMIMTKVTQSVVNCFRTCVDYAADFTETLGKTEVVFGDMSDAVLEWSESSIDSMGIAQSTALDMASLYGDMATGMGIAGTAAADMSMDLTQLAADLSSFKNIGVDQAASALRGIFTGEGEALKSLGVIMNETTLSAFALEQGFTKSYSQMSQQEKVMLRYQYVMSATANAQGDFARTGDSLANKQKKLGESVKQLATSFGNILAPAVSGIVSVIQSVVSFIDGLDPTIKTIILTIGGFVAALGPVLLAITAVQKAATICTAALTAMQLAAWQFVAIAAAVMAIIAAVVAIGNAMSASRPQIDETTKSYAQLSGAIEEAAAVEVGDKDVTVTVSTEIDDNKAAAIKAFTDQVDAIGWEDKIFNVTYHVNGDSIADIEGYAAAIAAAATATDNFEEAVRSINKFLDEGYQQQLDDINTGASVRFASVAQAYTSGSMSYEDALEANRIIIEETAQQRAALEAEYDEIYGLTAKLADGTATNDPAAVLELYSDSRIGIAEAVLEDTEVMESAVASIADAEKNGGIAGFEEAITGSVALTNGLATATDELVAASNAYETARASAASYEDDAAEYEAAAEAATTYSDALSRVGDLMLMAAGDEGYTIDDAISKAAEEYGIEAEALSGVLMDINGNGKISTDEIANSAVAQSDAATAALESAATARETAAGIMADADAAFATAVDNIAIVTDGVNSLDAEGLEGLILSIEKAGIEIPEDTKAAVLATQGMIDDINNEIRDGGEGIASETSTMIQNTFGGVDTSDAKTVGSNLIAGITTGLEGGSSALYTTMQTIVTTAISKAKQAAAIHSPSRIMRDEVGKQLVAGISVGIDDETPSAIKRIQESVKGIIGGARELSLGGVVNEITANSGVNYSAIGEAMSNAVNGLKLAFNVSGKTIAEATQEDDARASAARSRALALGLGRW